MKTTIEEIVKNRPAGHVPNGVPQPAGKQAAWCYRNDLINGNEQTLYVIAVLLDRLNKLEESP